MQYDPNKGWEYEHHPKAEIVRTKCYELIHNLSASTDERDCTLIDTRRSHLFVYSDVTPTGHEYFAGNYRGASVGFLRIYDVGVGKYPGAQAHLVEALMEVFAHEIHRLLDDFNRVIINSAINAEQRLLNYCALLSKIFTKFLVIHPYANGNGHMARLIAWILLQKQGLASDFWSVADRPGTPRGVPLDECIVLFREGNLKPLMMYFLKGINSGKPVVREDIEEFLPKKSVV
ncbi:hypothetical protein EYC51_03490 [Alcaligenes faecalis]|nr:hypothetical protein EYC51_03490 [Alcaligenes faecalis]